MADSIKCPQCRAEIPLSDVISHQIEDRLAAELARKLGDQERELARKLADGERALAQRLPAPGARTADAGERALAQRLADRERELTEAAAERERALRATFEEERARREEQIR